jgi:hypothetical protein
LGEIDSDKGAVCEDDGSPDHDDNTTIEETIPTHGWKVNEPFQRVETMSKFEEVSWTRSVRCDGELRVGSTVVKSSANSPIKAWRLLMTNSILETIVDCSNEYGKLQVGTDFYNEITKG